MNYMFVGNDGTTKRFKKFKTLEKAESYGANNCLSDEFYIYDIENDCFNDYSKEG